ncbi:ECF transporter S component [Corynebacterium choanae]|uniref:HMP/thiamine permease protein YkoE n=1 Tax=Corynebacterium choanae TaxID=1862358 RepID=A0A3G6J532_9CORY|nr:ECF transporter S component [Corynebacterium choanae]AZA13201.1 Putative HMP/thiamine permease protein YkoE [Corynebacterium choanae]
MSTPTYSSSSAATPTVSRTPALRWTVADILIATVLGIAAGLIFWVYNGPGYAWYEAFNAITPGLGGLATGPWLFAAVLGALAIRKPGAAIYCEVVAASVSAGLGNNWGIATLYSGIAQGIGAELIILAFLYRRFGLAVAALAGAGAGLGAWTLEFFMGNAAKTVQFNVTYLVCNLISGLLIAGVLTFFITRALVAAGALDRVRAGRDNTVRV